MAKPGPAPSVTPEDVLEVFAARDDPTEPLTAPEIANELGCSRSTALDKLRRLAERGDVRSKKVGGRSRVWWIPGEEAAPAAPLKNLVGMLDEDEADRAEQRQREWREGFDEQIEDDRLKSTE